MRKSTLVLGGLGLGAAAAVAYAAMGSDDSSVPEPGRPPGPPGPLPRRHAGGMAPFRAEPPEPMDPAGLWVSGDCSTWNVGPMWDGRRLLPALQAWSDAGWSDRERFDHHTVVRETLRPYVRCIDAWPWADLFSDATRPSPDEWSQRWREADSRYPEVATLIQTVFAAYGNILSGALQAEPVYAVDHPDGRMFEFYGSEMAPTMALPAFSDLEPGALESMALGDVLRSQGFAIKRVA